jgi:hypothetical protein
MLFVSFTAHDTRMRALEFYDADIQDYPRIPCHLIFDEEGASSGRSASRSSMMNVTTPVGARTTLLK